jgi:hypothetical protein
MKVPRYRVRGFALDRESVLSQNLRGSDPVASLPKAWEDNNEEVYR